MTNQVIPEAAVEAAARGIYRHLMPYPMPIWAELEPDTHVKYREIARAALEAAAPHMHPSGEAKTAIFRLNDPSAKWEEL